MRKILVTAFAIAGGVAIAFLSPLAIPIGMLAGGGFMFIQTEA